MLDVFKKKHAVRGRKRVCVCVWGGGGVRGGGRGRREGTGRWLMCTCMVATESVKSKNSRRCTSVKVEVDVLGSPSLIVCTVSVDVKQHLKTKIKKSAKSWKSADVPLPAMIAIAVGTRKIYEPFET